MTELSREDKDGIVLLYNKLTEARQTLLRANHSDYLAHGSVDALIVDITNVQDKLLSVVISGELPLQPVAVMTRNFIGPKPQ